jgi:hypothetical protein
MNKTQVLFHLGGARIHLDEMIKAIESDREHDGFPEFYAQLPFVYRNLNRAWNIRFKNDEELAGLSEVEAKRVYLFPEDLNHFISD